MHYKKSEAIEWQRNISENRESGLSKATFAESPAVPEDKAGGKEQFFFAGRKPILKVRKK